MSFSKPPEILVIQRRMTHYRLPFFEALKSEIANRGGVLKVAYGDGTTQENSKMDGAELPWGAKLKTSYVFSGRVCWQPFGEHISTSSVAVFASENKLLYNLYAQLASRARIILWGHGANLQGDSASKREKFKRVSARAADWWFGYTEYSRPIIEATEFPKDRITILNNSVDTRELNALLADVTQADITFLAKKLELELGKVGLYLGSLYEEKRIDFLLESGAKLATQFPGFKMLIVGDGPLRSLVEHHARGNSWLHYLGSLRGKDKAITLRLATVILNPGLVGLGILDGFAARVPLITTDCGLHSPEIAYLKNGVNGVMTANTLDAFVNGALNLLREPELRDEIALGCADANKIYTVEHMAERFAEGCFNCLNASRRNWPARRKAS